MNKLVQSALSFSCLVFSSAFCLAQGYVPARNVIFEDYLKTDSINAFPSKWEDSHYFKTLAMVNGRLQSCAVNQNGTYKCIDIPFETGILPKMTTFAVLGDSFSVDYDVYTFKESVFRFSIFDETTENHGRYDYFTVGVSDSGYVEYNSWNNDVYLEHHDQFPGVFDYSKWHHISFSYYNGILNYYIDGKRSFDLSECKCISPKTAKLLLYNKGHVIYANIKIATNTNLQDFSKLLTGTKFVTHDINFGVMQTQINTKSMPFVQQLAKWLIDNPRVKLEIDGHTDNDGTDAANLKLSQERANEVKKQLVLLGVQEDRLFAIGLGSEMPIEPNSTPQGRAANRRVELIKK